MLAFNSLSLASTPAVAVSELSSDPPPLRLSGSFCLEVFHWIVRGIAFSTTAHPATIVIGSVSKISVSVFITAGRFLRGIELGDHRRLRQWTQGRFQRMEETEGWRTAVASSPCGKPAESWGGFGQTSMTGRSCSAETAALERQAKTSRLAMVAIF